MFRPKSNFFLFSYCILNLFVIIYLLGFFPIDQRNLSLKTDYNESAQLRRHTNAVKTLVLVVIDALRTDFVDSSKHKNDMPFIQSSLESNRACLMKVRTAAPTVTMPRLKAITSGAMSNYLDVVLNMGGSEFKQDTFIRQAYLHGMSLVFYGDDTWLKLFPHYFKRAGPTHSFFAADYWEVDSNVTKQVTSELLRDDWDVMVLHYLGLDHIGHMEGPYSSHVPTKLSEMDEIIKKIYQYLQDKGSYLFIVTGDHGMKDSGGHGGVTKPEVYVPLLSFGHPCRDVPGWPNAQEHTPDQTDLAPTLSTALGLPIPQGNTGKIIPAVLHHVQPDKITGILEELKSFLIKRAGENNPSEEYTKESFRGTNASTAEMNAIYFEELSRLSSSLNKHGDEYNLLYMAVGCCGMWILCISFIFIVRRIQPANALQVTLCIGTVCHTVSLASSSFIEEEHQTWYYLWVTFLLLCLRERWRRKLVVRSYVPDIKSCSLIILCVLHRLLRKLNQTGDKWAHLPDWDDFLRQHECFLFLLYISGLLWTYKLFTTDGQHRSQLSKRLYLTALTSILAYRLSVASFSLPAQLYPQSRGTAEVLAFFLVIILFTFKSVIKERTEMKWLWALLAALTMRPHNVILIPTMIFTSQQLFNVFSRVDNQLFWNTLAHLWMGSVFYFYQGHSNSIANIDVAPAFIGVRDYYPIYAGLLMVIHTYSAPVLSFLLSPTHYGAVLLSRLLPMSLYCTLTFFQRHHLFVWSVFSPKLLLDASLTVVLFLVALFHKIGVTYVRK